MIVIVVVVVVSPARVALCRDSVPRMPRQALMMVAGVTGAELAKREIAAQVWESPAYIRGPARCGARFGVRGYDIYDGLCPERCPGSSVFSLFLEPAVPCSCPSPISEQSSSSPPCSLVEDTAS